MVGRTSPEEDVRQALVREGIDPLDLEGALGRLERKAKRFDRLAGETWDLYSRTLELHLDEMEAEFRPTD